MRLVPLYLALLLSPLLAFGENATPAPANAKPKPAKPAAYIDPDHVDDPDYKFQGEYVGEHEGNRQGVQVIALGDGKFEAVHYHGGLPGDGWDGDKSSVAHVEGSLSADTGKVVFHKDDLTANLDGKSIAVSNGSNEPVLQLNRVDRKSPTLGQAAPAGAIILFSDKDHNHFTGVGISPEGWLEQGGTSTDLMGDCTLHVEFLLSYMPKARGQGRSNSGVYMQSRYEVQVLDSFGLEGKNNECGGVYSIHAPLVNMCFPPLAWQTYDIDFTAAKYDAAGKKTADARMTVKHNGVLVQNNVAVPHVTTAAPKKEENSEAPLYLQNHGNPVRFKNVWMVKK